ncbi:MAG: hypothetical protein KJ749_01590 [Planctomycetes bacterium]|nr:hypothetical protein [Planctomycetota bacterium]
MLGRLVPILMGLCLLGCGGRPSRVAPPALDPAGAAAEAIRQFDTNGDGRLASSELEACPGLKAAAGEADQNGDGELSAEEIAGRIGTWAADRVAMVAVNCSVVRNGRPLPGARVTFVPEKFLGPNIKPASGTSNDAGRVDLAVEGAQVQGMCHCGFFRVEVSKKEGGRELIPAKYNSQTVLGEEIVEDSMRRKQGIVLDVSGG